MNLFDKLKDVLAQKSNSEKANALLAETITQTANQFLNYEGIHARSIQKHLDRGKAAFATASEYLKVDDQEESLRTAHRGIIHLHIAQLLLSGKYPEKVELNAAADSTEAVLNDLIKRIAENEVAGRVRRSARERVSARIALVCSANFRHFNRGPEQTTLERCSPWCKCGSYRVALDSWFNRTEQSRSELFHAEKPRRFMYAARSNVL